MICRLDDRAEDVNIEEGAAAMSFWDVVWSIVISFAFIVYLMMVFSIIGDLFRDPKASGFVKAMWFLALIFLPFLSAVVYLIARGPGMVERQAQSTERIRAQQDAYIRDVVGKAGPGDQIAQAKSLLDSGTISPEEYERLKKKALA